MSDGLSYPTGGAGNTRESSGSQRGGRQQGVGANPPSSSTRGPEALNTAPFVQVDEYPAPPLFSVLDSGFGGMADNSGLYPSSSSSIGASNSLYSSPSLPAPSPPAASSSSPAHLLLQHAMGLTIDILVTYGVSPEGIDLLKANGLETVSDLANLNTHTLPQQGFSDDDVDTLTRLAVEVCQEVTNEKLQLLNQQKRKGQNATGLAGDSNLPIKNTFINFPPSRLIPSKKAPQSCPVDMTPPTLPNSFASTLGNDSNLSPVASSRSPDNSPIDINLSAYPSIGSRLHASGTCKPCAWYYHASGCRHGAQCEFCHLCPPGEIKRRKKEKLQIIKLLKQSQQQQENALDTSEGMYNRQNHQMISNSTSSTSTTGGHHHHRHHHHTGKDNNGGTVRSREQLYTSEY